MSIDIPKLPLVSNSRTLAPSARLSHALTRPSNEVAARYCPSPEMAMAQSSPALFWSVVMSKHIRGSRVINQGNSHLQFSHSLSISRLSGPTLTAPLQSQCWQRTFHFCSLPGGDTQAYEPSRWSAQVGSQDFLESRL